MNRALPTSGTKFERVAMDATHHDQRWSVAPESLGEDLVDALRDAVLGCTDSDEGGVAA